MNTQKNYTYLLSEKQKYYRKRNYFLDIDFFENIDTPEKAYILGYFYADGYVNINKGITEICLHQQDIDILNKIHKSVGGKLRSFKENMMRLSFYSKKICEDLTKHGCHQNKTFTLVFPEITSTLYSHFIRGYFDGDGCISLERKGKGAVVNFAGNYQFLTKLSEYLSKILQVKINNLKKHKNIYYLCFNSRKDITTLLNFLYTNSSLHLSRKYDKFIVFLNRKHKEIYVDNLKNDYLSGLSLGQLSEKYEISKMTVYNKLKPYGVFHKPNITEDTKEKIYLLLQQGKGAKEIMDILNISQTTFYRYYKKYKNASN